ncbi:alpha/beta fold hydrolase [Thalassospira povalilytica]|uniref:alpha/beta fold hydrolase n=1 Tax=Thalassospira povalilytica TaxID=732237 RepID=UPI001F36259E|nr:alpha/beta fold hydrolase [Thalassospira povalilytica]
MTSWLSSRAALPIFLKQLLPWKPELKEQAENLLREIEAFHPDDIAQALDRVAFDRHAGFHDGVRSYQRHPYRRPRDGADGDIPVIWEDGSTRVYDYGALSPDDDQAAGKYVLLVPSLVNRGYILDLNEKRSFARYLAKCGYRPLLVEWGYPGIDEANFGLDDYIAARLVTILQDVADMNGGPVPVVGYCMGGVLALAATLLDPAQVSKLVLLATPWDFMAAGPTQSRIAAAFAPSLPHMLAIHDTLPVDVLQSLFASLDPFMIGEKFRRFGQMATDSARAHDFVALEDWLNDGVPLTRRVSVDCLIGWYVENKPAKGEWQIDGIDINPADLSCPVLAVIPENDRIVPPESAKALFDAFPEDLRTELHPSSGHIGMMVGSRAEKSTWDPVAKWLAGDRPAP